jgi:Integrase core domain
MTTSLKIHELNEYPEFKNTYDWKKVREFVRSIQAHEQDSNEQIKFPRGLNEKQKIRYANHFSHNFYAEPGGRLFYRPKDDFGDYRVNLQVLYPTKEVRNQAIKGIYDDDKVGLGLGEEQFWEAVSSRYIGITKDMTNQFLHKQTDWQLTRPYFHKTNHPFTSGDGSNQRWYIDCVFLYPYTFDVNKMDKFSVTSHNTEYEDRYFPDEMAGLISYRFLLTCVDGFSKKLWAEPMIAHTAKEVVLAFKKMMRDAENTKPRVCVHDNGSEFQGEFKKFLKDEGIKNVETQSYSPMGNLAERYNRVLREKIRAGIVRHDNLEFVKHLQDYVQNINNMRHNGSKFTPNQIWTPGYRRLGDNLMRNINDENVEDLYPIKDTSDWNEIRMRHRWDSIIKANRILNREEPKATLNIFKPGDLVRIAGEVAYSKTRARNKDGSMKKYNAVIWTPEVYRINSIVNQKHFVLSHNPTARDFQNLGLNSFDLRRPRYNLQRMDGSFLSRQYYGSELQKIPKNSTTTTITPYRSGQLNRLYEYED